MEKPYKIVKLDSPQEIERLDNLLTLLFNNLQEIRHRVSSTTPVVGQLKEGEIIFLDDGSGDRQLYAKIKNTLFNLQNVPVKAICKGWVNFDGTTNVGGNCTIRGSYNVDHVEDLGTGRYKVYWGTDFANVNYVAVGATLLGHFVSIEGTEFLQTNYARIGISDHEGTLADRTWIMIIAFGVQ